MKTALCFGVIGILAFATREAAAQDSGIGGMSTGDARSGPSWGRPDVEPSPENGPAKQGKNSVKLFDSYRSTISYQLDIGPIWTRRASETTALSRRTNFDHKAPLASEIAIGSYYTTPSFKGPFFLTAEQATSLSILDGKSYLWTVFLNKLGGGVRFGPFELEGKVGLHVLSVDIMHAHPSIQLASPRVEAALGLHLGRFGWTYLDTPNTCGDGSGRTIMSGGLILGFGSIEFRRKIRFLEVLRSSCD